MWQRPADSGLELRVLRALEGLPLEVRTGSGIGSVTATLNSGRPGPTILLRADMDALPVTERNDLPFASKVRTTYNGVETGVMHACGHDTHVAIMMGVAEALAAMRSELPGTIKFMFQPAEEGPPQGERGGAELMIEEGVLANPKVDVAFALHINSQLETGHISYSPGGTYASADDYRILVKGTQTHGGYPWDGTDPVSVPAARVGDVSMAARPAVAGRRARPRGCRPRQHQWSTRARRPAK